MLLLSSAWKFEHMIINACVYMEHVIHGILSLYQNVMHMTFWLEELL